MSGPRALSLLLDLEPLGPACWRGWAEPGSPRVFGGLVMGQALRAAGLAMGPGLVARSQHSVFLRPGAEALPIDFAVSRLVDATAFVVAQQEGEVILELTASFVPGPAAVPSPVIEPPTGGFELAGEAQEWWATIARSLTLEARFIDEPVRSRVLRGERPEPWQRVWIRSAHRLGDDPREHAAALAYVSDIFLLSTALPPHGLVMGGPRVATISHAMWFHGPARADEWLLYVMDSPWSGGGRALCLGQLFTASGAPVASTAQEGVLRGAAS